MGDIAWLGTAEVSFEILETLQASSWDTLRLTRRMRRSSNNNDDDSTTTTSKLSALTSCVLQVVPSRSCPPNQALLHPMLVDFLLEADEVAVAVQVENGHEDADDSRSMVQQDGSATVSIAPLPITSISLESTTDSPNKWILTKLGTVDLPDSTTVMLECLYFEPAVQPSDLNVCLARALQGRILQPGTTVILATVAGYVVVTVTCLLKTGGEELPLDSSVAYRLASCDSFCVQSSVAACTNMSPTLDMAMGEPQEWQVDCPGYDKLVQEILSLVQLGGPAAPTGILLTGCAGVGKTRLVSCVAGACVAQGWTVHSVSIHDLLLAASWASEDQLFELLEPPNRSDNDTTGRLVVLDDLHILAIDSSEGESSMDAERRLVYNSLLQVIDRLVKRGVPVLGVAHTVSQLPVDLTKIGRLEKQVSMLPPTERQRESILLHMLQHMALTDKVSHRWEEVLAPMTAGCIALDLRRICADAQTRVWARTGDPSASPSWDDLRESVRQCVPSQLATLDVTKGPSFVGECSLDDWPRIHELAWKEFAGYAAMKKRVYRTVVIPWRRRLKSSANDSTSMSALVPPSGVLFHGISGAGKTFAAQCLGASLGLPMIKVRASDVLDKWLGGSEAAIRSLFSRARAASPVILFFDEIDAIASNRATDGETSDVMSRLLSTLLNEMDGVSSGRQASVVVVACTNRLDTLDAALLRPGRLEEHVLLEKPSATDVEAILRLRLAKARLQDDVELATIAEGLVSKGATCADVEGLSREAVMRCLRRMDGSSNPSVSMADFASATNSLSR